MHLNRLAKGLTLRLFAARVRGTFAAPGEVFGALGASRYAPAGKGREARRLGAAVGAALVLLISTGAASASRLPPLPAAADRTPAALVVVGTAPSAPDEPRAEPDRVVGPGTLIRPAAQAGDVDADGLAAPLACEGALSQPDARFGVVVSGDSPSIPAALQHLGASSWFQFGTSGPGPGQAALVRPGQSLDDLHARAAAAPGSTWLIGNEPNVPGQDDLAPQAFADFVAEVASAVRQADPSAILVGPNVLNWEKTCTGCPGYTLGRAWSEAFVAYYREHYGPLPFNAWGMHTYSLDWDRLPLVDVEADQAQLAAARGWLDANGLTLPLWLTEFGIIWGFEGVEWVQRADGTYQAEPRGALRQDLMGQYIERYFAWLTGPGAAARVDRWYLYATAPPPEPYATTLAGIALFEPGSLRLTPFGERYRAWAYGCGTG